jgi:hypothetical protein
VHTHLLGTGLEEGREAVRHVGMRN